MNWQGSARAWLSLLYNGPMVMDVLQASLDMGLLRLLDAGPVTLSTLSTRLDAVPGRLLRLLDCLEGAGLVRRIQLGTEIGDARYESVEPLTTAAQAILGPTSVARTRDRHAWPAIHGKLVPVVRGQDAAPPARFESPRTAERLASLETSMALCCAPIVDSFLASSRGLFNGALKGGHGIRMLDVGGGDAMVGIELSRAIPALDVDVFDLPVARAGASARIENAGLASRMKFIAGDFLEERLPEGYDVLSFVRVLQEMPDAGAVELLRNAWGALPPGGRVFICEEFRTPERLAVQLFWSYFLIGRDQCVTRLREADFYSKVLADIGFTEIQCVHGPFDILVAVRP